MQYITRTGTTGELEIKIYRQPGDAKKHLRTRIDKRREWAKRFNTDLYGRLTSVREQIDGLDLGVLKIDEVRRWSEEDDYTGVWFVFEVEKAMG